MDTDDPIVIDRIQRAFAPSANGHVPTSIKLSRSVRLWRYLRRLVRRRQETHAVQVAMDVARKATRDADDRVRRAEQRVADLQETLAARESKIREMTELTIPKIERERAVFQEEAKYLAALHKRELKTLEADIAVQNMREHGALEIDNRIVRGT